MTGTGIRAEARKELERQSRLRQDARPVLDVFRSLLDQLAEVEIPTSLTIEPVALKATSLDAILVLPPVHPDGERGVRPWGADVSDTAAYRLAVSPWGGYVELQGPYDIEDGRIVEPESSWDRDPAYIERFKVEGSQASAGLPPLEDFVERVRGLAIAREVGLMSAEAGTSPSP